jgi:hypothetical protein
VYKFFDVIHVVEEISCYPNSLRFLRHEDMLLGEVMDHLRRIFGGHERFGGAKPFLSKRR